jgi:uncharacterized membrane protein YoaK (UPF0700 family)
MHTLSKHTLLFAMALTALAGCVDAAGCRPAAWRLADSGLADIDYRVLRAGATVGAIIRHRARKRPAASVLTMVALLLAFAALCDSTGVNSTAMLIKHCRSLMPLAQEVNKPIFT